MQFCKTVWNPELLKIARAYIILHNYVEYYGIYVY